MKILTVKLDDTFAEEVDKERRIKPGNYLGHLSDEEMEAIDEMMRIFGGLDPTYGFRF